MKFELHKKFRFEFDWLEKEYQKAKRKYLSHLKKINFKGRASFGKYFGNSFFHDANVKDITICFDTGIIILHLFTSNDLEDINIYRQAKGAKPISWHKYNKNPIVYKCVFNKVTNVLFQGNIDLTEEQTVVDTELDFIKKTNEFIVRISFSEQEEVEIYFKGSASVKIDNNGLISDYLNGYRKSIPRCNNCKSRLLNLNALK